MIGRDLSKKRIKCERNSKIQITKHHRKSNLIKAVRLVLSENLTVDVKVKNFNAGLNMRSKKISVLERKEKVQFWKRRIEADSDVFTNLVGWIQKRKRSLKETPKVLETEERGIIMKGIS